MKEEVTPAHEFMNKDSQFYQIGYEVFRGPYELWKKEIRNPFEIYLLDELRKFRENINIDCIENYHLAFNKDKKEHHSFIKKISRMIPQSVINKNNPYLDYIKQCASKKVNKTTEIFADNIEFRVVRPNSYDNNKLHRDHWFPYFKPLINIYLPLSGSDHRSVLRIVPESHLWTDEDVIPTFNYEQGKSTNEEGIKFSTPNIKESSKDLIEHKPDVLEGDFMLFSPLSVHGGGSNSGHKTRFSLEIRLCLIDN